MTRSLQNIVADHVQTQDTGLQEKLTELKKSYEKLVNEQKECWQARLEEGALQKAFEEEGLEKRPDVKELQDYKSLKKGIEEAKNELKRLVSNAN